MCMSYGQVSLQLVARVGVHVYTMNQVLHTLFGWLMYHNCNTHDRMGLDYEYNDLTQIINPLRTKL